MPSARKAAKSTPDPWVESLPAATGRAYERADTAPGDRVRGLSIRVQPSGVRAWFLRWTVKSKDRRLRLGGYPALGLVEARVKAHETLRAVDYAQQDPAADRAAERAEARARKAGATVARAVKAWTEDEKMGPAARWRGGLEGGAARCLLGHVRAFVRTLGPALLADVTPQQIEAFVSESRAVGTRNKRLSVLRTFFRWAVRKSLVTESPALKVERERGEAERSRVLTDDELRALVRGFDATPWGRAVRFLALTALRREEVMSARWSWLDRMRPVLVIPNEAAKEGRARREPREVALSPYALALLAEQRKALFAAGLGKCEWIFPTPAGERAPRNALWSAVSVLRGRKPNGQAPSSHPRAPQRPAAVLPADAHLHDVRRTVADALLRRLGVSPDVVNWSVMGHVRPKLLRTYMPVLPIEPPLAALTAWGDLLSATLGEPVLAREPAATDRKAL